MMNIDVFGKSKNISLKEVRYAVTWFAKALLGDVADELDIIVSLEKNNGNHDGFCFPIDYMMAGNPRTFEISLNHTKRRYQLLKILAHEIVHVKQYALGELKMEGRSAARWNGKKHILADDIVTYLNYPWEIEAFGRENGMYVLYRAFLKKNKVSFGSTKKATKKKVAAKKKKPVKKTKKS